MTLPGKSVRSPSRLNCGRGQLAHAVHQAGCRANPWLSRLGADCSAALWGPRLAPAHA